MTDKLELMLINVLFDQFLNIKVSRGSAATRLRCDEIFNDHFITLVSQRVKKKWKSVNICQSYGQLSTRLFFMKHGVDLQSSSQSTTTRIPTLSFLQARHPSHYQANSVTRQIMADNNAKWIPSTYKEKNTNNTKSKITHKLE